MRLSIYNQNVWIGLVKTRMTYISILYRRQAAILKYYKDTMVLAVYIMCCFRDT